MFENDIKHSFSLIEIILIVAIIAIILGLGLPFYVRFQRSHQLNTTTQEIAQTLRRAWHKAVSQEQDQKWGVYFSNRDKKYVLFNQSYPSQHDEEFSLPADLSLNSSQGDVFNVAFEKLFGNTEAINISLSTLDGQTKTIKVTEEGKIEIVGQPLTACAVSDECLTGLTVLNLSQTKNAHAELTDQLNYNYKVCCENMPGLSTTCQGNYVVALKISEPTNAHGEKNNQNNYPYQICLSAPNGIDLQYASRCAEGYTCLLSFSGDTNAHLGHCRVYREKVCFKINQ